MKRKSSKTASAAKPAQKTMRDLTETEWREFICFLERDADASKELSESEVFGCSCEGTAKSAKPKKHPTGKRRPP
jgi:hypothetical protein